MSHLRIKTLLVRERKRKERGGTVMIHSFKGTESGIFQLQIPCDCLAELFGANGNDRRMKRKRKGNHLDRLVLFIWTFMQAGQPYSGQLWEKLLYICNRGKWLNTRLLPVAEECLLIFHHMLPN